MYFMQCTTCKHTVKCIDGDRLCKKLGRIKPKHLMCEYYEVEDKICPDKNVDVRNAKTIIL